MVGGSTIYYCHQYPPPIESPVALRSQRRRREAANFSGKKFEQQPNGSLSSNPCLTLTPSKMSSGPIKKITNRQTGTTDSTHSTRTTHSTDSTHSSLLTAPSCPLVSRVPYGVVPISEIQCTVVATLVYEDLLVTCLLPWYPLVVCRTIIPMSKMQISTHVTRM